MISPLVLFCFQGRLIKQFGELITFFLPIQEPPRSGTLCDFTENALHRQSKTCRMETSEVDSTIEEILSHIALPYEHWTRQRTNNALERIMKEIRGRTRVIGAFSDGYSVKMLVGARLRHISTTKWVTRLYLNTCKLYTSV